VPPRPADLAEIDNFCDALWLEDGLAKATLDSYRSDLGRLAAGWPNTATKPCSISAKRR
jgi:integrase/recombinase XerD